MEDSIVEEVRLDLLTRSKVGIKKYGVTLDREDLDLIDWLQHAYEEGLDKILYLKRARKKVIEEKWVYEDELPPNYPYDENFHLSRLIDGVRMFPKNWGKLQLEKEIAQLNDNVKALRHLVDFGDE